MKHFALFWYESVFLVSVSSYGVPRRAHYLSNGPCWPHAHTTLQISLPLLYHEVQAKAANVTAKDLSITKLKDKPLANDAALDVAVIKVRIRTHQHTSDKQRQAAASRATSQLYTYISNFPCKRAKLH